jgi:hypothetical protein
MFFQVHKLELCQKMVFPIVFIAEKFYFYFFLLMDSGFSLDLVLVDCWKLEQNEFKDFLIGPKDLPL